MGEPWSLALHWLVVALFKLVSYIPHEMCKNRTFTPFFSSHIRNRIMLAGEGKGWYFFFLCWFTACFFFLWHELWDKYQLSLSLIDHWVSFSYIISILWSCLAPLKSVNNVGKKNPHHTLIKESKKCFFLVVFFLKEMTVATILLPYIFLFCSCILDGGFNFPN